MRTLLLSTFLLALAALPARADVIAREGQGFLEKRPDGRLVLHLKGTPYEMGYQQGKLVGDLAKKTMHKVVDGEGDFARSEHYLAYQALRPMMHGLLRPHIPARFIEEMKGLAAGSGVPYEKIEAGNLFPAAFHCSGIALSGKATKDGSLYHVRILDYMTQLGLQDAALIVIHEPKDGHRWLNVGFAGFLGSVTGMNDQQVAIGEMGGGGLGYWDGVPMPFLIRDALERADTMEQALEIFKQSKRTCEYYYVISDGKTRRATGVWATHDTFETVKPGQGFAFFEKLVPQKGAADFKSFASGVKVEAGPHRILFRGEKGVRGFIAMPPADSLVISGYDRYQHFIDRLLPGYGKVDERALMEMVKRPVSMKSNLHVAIFHPETLEVWVAVAAPDGDPACNQPYARYSLAAPAAPTGAATPAPATEGAGANK
ncbi:MAG: C45 family autoproteolytic acyltransferase/hydrolase [Planctomycetota bacterium]